MPSSAVGLGSIICSSEMKHSASTWLMKLMVAVCSTEGSRAIVSKPPVESAVFPAEAVEPVEPAEAEPVTPVAEVFASASRSALRYVCRSDEEPVGSTPFIREISATRAIPIRDCPHKSLTGSIAATPVGEGGWLVLRASGRPL